MDNRTLYSKTVRFQRVAVKNAFSILSIFQDHGEQFLKKNLAQNPWLPERGKRTYTYLADTYHDSAKLFERIVDRNFDDMEKLYRAPRKTQAKETQPKKAETPSPARMEENPAKITEKTAAREKTGAKPAAPVKGGQQKKPAKPEPSQAATVSLTAKEAKPSTEKNTDVIPLPDKPK